LPFTGGAMFADRRAAGRQLAARLHDLRQEEPLVLALPRGGVPVGFEVARKLDAPLDVLLVRKIGVPWQPELALGAVVDGADPQVLINEGLAIELAVARSYITTETARQLSEIERRRRVYLGDRPAAGARQHRARCASRRQKSGSPKDRPRRPQATTRPSGRLPED